MLFLIDDRPGRPPDGERRAVDPDWPLVLWVLLAVGLLVLAGMAEGLPAFLMICGSVYAGCRAVMRVLDYWGGLTEWHQ